MHAKPIMSRLWGRIRPQRVAALCGVRTHVQINGRRFHYDPRSAVGQALSKYGSFEAEEIAAAARLIGDDHVVLDIGANIGLHTVNFAARAGKGTVIAVEPQIETAALLARNVAGYPNIVTVPVALSDGGGDVRFKVASDGAYSGLVDTQQRPIVATRRLLAITGDLLVEALRLPRLDLVKIDVEGHQAAVLRGLAGALDRFRPIVWCEIGYGLASKPDHSGTMDLMRGLGFSVYVAEAGALRPFGRQHDHVYNFFFVPPQRRVKAA